MFIVTQGFGSKLLITQGFGEEIVAPTISGGTGRARDERRIRHLIDLLNEEAAVEDEELALVAAMYYTYQ